MARNLRSSWRRWLNRSLPALQSRRRHPWRKRLFLEALEDRTLLTVTVLNSFSGMSSATQTSLSGYYYEPPDTQGAAGPSNAVETANQAITLYSLTGTYLGGDSLANFWLGQGGLAKADSASVFSDPVVTYDPLISRFIVGDQDVDGHFVNGSSTQNKSYFDIAVSKSSDPTTLSASSWNFFQVATTESQNGTHYDPDYPGNLGYNADALVFTLNMFDQNNFAAQSQIDTVNISALVNGTALTEGTNAFQSDYAGFSLRPTAMQDSKTGDPMWFVTEHGDKSSIDVVKMTNLLSNSPTVSTTNLAVNAYSTAVPELQPNGTQITTNTDSRIMNAAEDNNLLVAAHQVSDSADNLDEIQWYEISVAGGSPTLKQQGDVSGGPGTYYAYPGIDINASGDIGMSYTASGTGVGQYLSMYVTGRTPNDFAGRMQTPVLVQAGTSNYNYSPFSYGREGDLSGINLASDGSFWAVNEDTANVANPNWGTAFGHFSVSGTGLTSIYTVTNTNNSGTGSLSAAIAAVNAGTDNEIDFNIPGSGVQTINLTSALPAITASGVFINGLSQGGSGNMTPLIQLDGTSAGNGSDGLLLKGSNCLVSGLIIENFKGNGIEIAGSTNTIGGLATGAENVFSGNAGDGVLIDLSAQNNQLEGNYVGTDPTGTSAVANGNGIVVQGPNNTIGGTAAGARNVISGNTLAGNNNYGIEVYYTTTTGVLIQGNYVGTNAAGTVALANNYGIVDFGANNTIGGTSSGAGNVLSGNTTEGLYQYGLGGLVQGNYVGTNAAGTAAVANLYAGIEVNGSNNTLGGTASGAGNVLSGNAYYGVTIDSGISGTLVQGNLIGTDVTGTSALSNENGVSVSGSNNTIGGVALSGSINAAANVLSGNSNDGVLINSGATGVAVQGNRIGTDATGSSAVRNSTGIEVQGSNNVIGGTAAGDGNLISGNLEDGVLIGANATGVAVDSNYVGTNYNGTSALGNYNGIEIVASNNSIGGTVTGQHNVISGNIGDGIWMHNGATGVVVQNNFIGTNVQGTAAVANGTGVEVGSSNNTIGGSVLAARNVVSGNSGGDGVLIDSGVTGVAVQGNYVGTDHSGTSLVGNGTGIAVFGNNNTIGGTVAGARNLISGNFNGLDIQNASGVQVQGNYVGINVAGNAALANFNGIVIAASNNTIGGTVTGARNLISGNNEDGVVIESGVSGVAVQGNYVGTSAGGTHAIANGVNGIEILGSNNTIGGTITAARNVVSGNSGDGVLIDDSATGNQVQGNYVGTDYRALSGLGNSGSGIEVQASNNTIGGTVTGARNVVSANSNAGVLIDNNASGVSVLGNYVGISGLGTSALGNLNGVEVQSSNNTIGGTVAGAKNVISGNSNDGVLIDSTAAGVAVQGDFIGTNAVGTAFVANNVNGVEANGAGVTVGGTVTGAHNVLSGNGNDGVLIGSAATGAVVQGNFIGTNAAGNAALGNKLNGVEVGSSGALVGGSAANTRNVISGNSNDGVLIDSTAIGVQVQGNYLGTNVAGTSALDNTNGVEIAGLLNTIGGTSLAARNVISGNSLDGIVIDSSGSGNVVQGNFIGTDHGGSSALHNGGYGVNIGGSGNNVIGGSVAGAGNTLAFNSQGGVNVRAGNGNAIRQNAIFSNGGSQTGPGITELAGVNNSIVAPTIASATLVGTTLTVKGTFTATASATYVLEFFANPLLDAEGKVFLGRLTLKPSSAGTVSFTFVATTTATLSNPVITATLTDSFGAGDTSAFSAGVTTT